MPRKPKDTDYYQTLTRINADGERVYISVHVVDGRIVEATNAYETADAASTGLHLRGEQAMWVARNRDAFEPSR